MKEITTQLAKLLGVKSLVTISMTFVFCYLAATGHLGADLFLSAYMIVIGFYFGTQYSRGHTGEATPATPPEEAAKE